VSIAAAPHGLGGLSGGSSLLVHAGPQVQEDLAVAFRPREFAVGAGDLDVPELRGAARHLLNRCVPVGVVAHDTALPDALAPDLELRLHQRKHPRRRRHLRHGRKQQSQRDERSVENGEVHRRNEVLGSKFAGVGALVNFHTRVIAQLRVQLPVADIDGDHAQGAALQQAIGESAGGSANVQAVEPAHIDLKTCKSACELVAAARDELRSLAANAHFRVGRDPRAGLLDGRIVHDHVAGEDQRLRLVARFGEAIVDESLVEPNTGRGASLASLASFAPGSGGLGGSRALRTLGAQFAPLRATNAAAAAAMWSASRPRLLSEVPCS
jgi:hypothetical protein